VAADQKKAARCRVRLIFLDESGFSERPSVRRTWSPRGRTPVLRTACNWKRLSALAALVVSPAARSIGLCLRLRPGTVKQPEVIAYLRELKKHLRGRRALLLWDRLPAHRGARVRAYLARNAAWLEVEYFPPYAPELNPVEYFWSHLSRTDLANFVGDSLADVRREARRSAGTVRHRPQVLRGFLKASKLFTEADCQ
jgi:transposase